MAKDEANTAKKAPPKGGRKGGTLFPRIDLKQALEYSKKLVSKTHTGPLPEKTILPGVFKNAGPIGKVRASALKQFGLLEGKAEAYQASKLAKEIDAAPPEQMAPLLQQAFLSSKILKEIFTTYQDDTVSRASIEQRAKQLEVHPDSAAECAQIFMESAVTAGVGAVTGDSIELAKSGAVAIPAAESALADPGVEDEIDEQEDERAAVPLLSTPGSTNGDRLGAGEGTPPRPPAEKPAVAVNLNVDSSSDPDKLEKQLKLLRQYGVI